MNGQTRLGALRHEANARHNLHKDHASSRPLSEDYELIGLAGEFQWGQLTGFAMDMSRRPGGDGGVDNFIYLRYSVDVKTARKPYNLIHEQGKPFADIFVLAEYSDETEQATLLSWEWGRVLARAPVKDFGHGVLNHYIPATELQALDALTSRMLRLA